MRTSSSHGPICRGIRVAGTPAIAAPAASYAVDFSRRLENDELLPPDGGRLRCGVRSMKSGKTESETKTITCPPKRGNSSSHLRSLTPLPKDEYLALKRSTAELASIGRNINQIAKAANGGGRVPNSGGAEFRAMLKICIALRDNTKALLKANETSWETGRAAN